MKIRELQKYLTESNKTSDIGKELKQSGWKIKVAYYYPTIKITSPTQKVFKLLDSDAEDVFKLIPKDIPNNFHTDWILGHLKVQKQLTEQHFLLEGVYDPGILKAIFLIGGPGSGKSYVTQQLFGIDKRKTFSRHGLKLVNPDPAFENLLKKAQINPSDLDSMSKADPKAYSDKVDPIRNRAKEIEGNTEANYIDGRLGMILESTGKNVQNVKRLKEKLESIGYDCFLLYVNTDLETAKKRNQQRDRTIPEDLLVQMWSDSQKNLGELQRTFGPTNTLIMDNSTDSKVTSDISKNIEKFVNKPIRNPAGREWIKSELMNRNRK